MNARRAYPKVLRGVDDFTLRARARGVSDDILFELEHSWRARESSANTWVHPNVSFLRKFCVVSVGFFAGAVYCLNNICTCSVQVPRSFCASSVSVLCRCCVSTAWVVQ